MKSRKFSVNEFTKVKTVKDKLTLSPNLSCLIRNICKEFEMITTCIKSTNDERIMNFDIGEDLSNKKGFIMCFNIFKRVGTKDTYLSFEILIERSNDGVEKVSFLFFNNKNEIFGYYIIRGGDVNIKNFTLAIQGKGVEKYDRIIYRVSKAANINDDFIFVMLRSLEKFTGGKTLEKDFNKEPITIPVEYSVEVVHERKVLKQFRERKFRMKPYSTEFLDFTMTDDPVIKKKSGFKKKSSSQEIKAVDVNDLIRRAVDRAAYGEKFSHLRSVKKSTPVDPPERLSFNKDKTIKRKSRTFSKRSLTHSYHEYLNDKDFYEFFNTQK